MPFKFPVEEWKKMYKDNFGKEQTENERKVREKIIGFLNVNPHLLENRKPLSASSYGITDSAEATPIEYAVPNRRNWDNLARELGQVIEEKEMKALKKNMFIENVGLECWRNFKEYESTETKPLDKYKWDGEPDEISQQINRLKEEKNLDKQVEYFERAYEYCKQKELLASVLPTVLKNCIGKYGLDYAKKYPKFKEIYNEIGA